MRRQLFIVLAFSFVASVCAPVSAAAADVVLRPPTDALVLDPFRMPDGPYGPGNRGIEYATRPGDPIAAAGPGVVVFAGPVAGSLHVTIDHGSGLRTSYSFVEAITVRRGDVVDAGSFVARAGGPFHFGARIDGAYVDPAQLFGRPHVSVFLVPHDDPERAERWLDLQERSERLQYIEWARGLGGGWGLGDLVGAVRDVISVAGPLSSFAWVDPAQMLDDLARLADVAALLVAELSPLEAIETMVDLTYAVFWPPPCTPIDVEPVRPPGRRIAVVIDGIDSSSDEGESMAQLDLAVHGYAAGDTVRFSYAGGIVDDPTSAGWRSSMPSSQYGPADTRGDVEDMIDGFEQMLSAVAAANPGVPVDVYGHSLGGLVARHAIAAVGGAEGPVDIGVAVTFGSPHGGAPLAQALEAIVMTPAGTVLERGLEVVWGDDLLGSEIVEDLSESGFAGDRAHVAFPEGVHAVTIGDRGDIVVPASMASAPGARRVTLGALPNPTAHRDLPGHPGVDREIALALAGLPPTCEGVIDRVADVIQPRAIEHGEHALAAGLLVGGFVVGRA